MDDAPYFLEEAMPLFNADTVYKTRISQAKKLWKKFAAWVLKNEKIELPPAWLWLTPCEVA